MGTTTSASASSSSLQDGDTTTGTQKSDGADDTQAGLSKSVLTKIRFMGKLNHSHRMRVEERADLYRAIAELKEDRRRLSFDLEQERLAREDALKLQNQNGAVWDIDKPAWAAYENDKTCAICGKEAKRTKEFPCRVCPRVFHKLCLSKCGECRDADLQAAEGALSNAGWSCYICANLSILLTEEEINQLINEFDIYDTNNDEHISWEEFSARSSNHPAGSKKRHSQPGMELSKRLDFKLADQDNDNSLDWWEFLNYQAKFLIAGRSKEELMSILTEKEIIKCRSLFRSMDTDNDGTLTFLEAKQAVRKCCQKYAYGVSKEGLGDPSSQLDFHADIRAQMFVDGENKKRESVTWPEFLADQALYIICTRPNVSSYDIEKTLQAMNLG